MTAVDGALIPGSQAFGDVLSGYPGANIRDSTSLDGHAPVFAGATSANTPTIKSLVVHWTAGTDDVTSQSNLIYEVCFATTALGCTGGSYAPTVASVAGGTSVVVGGLNPGTTYFFCVRCRDGAGNRDTNNVTVSAATSSNLFFKMRGQDVDCLPTLTYRTWVAANAPDYAALQYVGTRCGVTPFSNVVVTNSWET